MRISRIHLVALLALVIPVPQAAHAYGDWYFGCSSGYVFQDSGTEGILGMLAAARDGLDPYDHAIEPGPRTYVGTFRQTGVDGWNGPGGFYASDRRKLKPPVAGAQALWRLYVWADPSMPTAAATDMTFEVTSLVLSPDYTYHLQLMAKPTGITGGPPVGSVWTLSDYPYAVTIGLPVYRSSDGLTGYVFDFTATVIPEPSALLALGAGLAGMAGLWRRRTTDSR